MFCWLVERGKLKTWSQAATCASTSVRLKLEASWKMWRLTAIPKLEQWALNNCQHSSNFHQICMGRPTITRRQRTNGILNFYSALHDENRCEGQQCERKEKWEKNFTNKLYFMNKMINIRWKINSKVGDTLLPTD